MSKEIIQWYSVDDDMPDDDETVFIFEPDSRSDKVWMGYHDGDDGWRYIDGRKTLFTVTHWATMLHGPKKPQPPENVNKVAISAHPILSEDVCSIKQAHQEIEKSLSMKIDRTTIHRWAVNGVKGVQLGHVRVGGKLVTSRQAIARFISQLTSTNTKL